ncbi:MAG: hypothetical protein ACRDTG_14035 [Pseudonocardiaceae bacterium]
MEESWLNPSRREGVLLPQNAAECAGLFEYVELAMQPGVRRFPWLEDRVWFTWTPAAFLG